MDLCVWIVDFDILFHIANMNVEIFHLLEKPVINERYSNALSLSIITSSGK